MNQYFPQLQGHSSRNINVKLDLFYYAEKADLKGSTCVETSNLAAKTAADFNSLKVEVDKIDAGTLKTLPADLSKLSNAADNHVVKKTVYDK